MQHAAEAIRDVPVFGSCAALGARAALDVLAVDLRAAAADVRTDRATRNCAPDRREILAASTTHLVAEHAPDDRADYRAGHAHVAIVDHLPALDPAALLGRPDDRVHRQHRYRVEPLARRRGVRVCRRRRRRRDGIRAAVVRNVDVVVPAVLYEINGLPARVVAIAELAPVLRMPGRNAQIDRLAHRTGRALDDDRLRIHDARRGRAADVDAAVEPRLADANRYSDVGGQCGCADAEGGEHADETLHGYLLVDCPIDQRGAAHAR